MKKLLKVLFVTFVFFVSSGLTVFAANKSPEPVLLAEVDIANAKIVSQNNNEFKISFSITNGKTAQVGVGYGVLLTDVKTNITQDEKVYEEFLNLTENSSLSKEISYKAPIFLSGDYKLFLTSKNQSGFPFSISYMGIVKISGQKNNILIDRSSCKFYKGSDLSKGMALKQSITSLPGEDIRFSCDVTNNTASSVNLNPSFSFREYSAYGSEVNISDNTGNSSISLAPQEKKTVSFKIPKIDNPKSYNVTFVLGNKGVESNKVFFNYSVRGVTASADNLSFDKDYYLKGDIANISLIWSYSSDKNKDANINIAIVNSSNKECSAKFSQNVTKDYSNPITKFPITITRNCYNPRAVVSIKDIDGKVLDQKTFSVKTVSVSDRGNIPNVYYYVAILLVLTLILVIFIIMNKNKKDTGSNGDSSNQKNINLNVFIFLISFLSLIPFGLARATTYYFNSGYCNGSMDVDFVSGNYYPGDSISVAGSLYATNCGFDTLHLEASTSGSSVALGDYENLDAVMYSDYTPTNGDVSGGGTLTAPSTPGTYSVTYGGYIGGITNKSVSYSYNVIPKPAPTVSVSASRTNIGETESTTITWTSSNATSCTCTRSSNGASCGSGTQNTSGTTYTGSQIKPQETFNVKCSN